MRNFFRNKIVKNGISAFDSEVEAEQLKALNIYMLLFSIENFILGLLDLFREFYYLAFYLFFISFFMLYAFFKKFKYKSNVKTAFYIVFSFSLFFISSFRGFYSGISLYYIPLVLSIPFIFNSYECKKNIIFIISLIAFQLILNISTHHLLFYNLKYTLEIQKEVFISSLLASMVWIFVTIYFVYRKEILLDEYYRKQTDSERSILDNNEKIVSIDDLNELILLAETKSNVFFIKFTEKLPFFIDNLYKDYPLLVQSEIEICAYIKLNFKTKDIARFTNSSIRSIEAKKYRIRRKMNLDKSEDINFWISNL